MEGKGEITHCPTCNEATKEERETLTFYNVIKLEVTQNVCVKGHSSTTDEECDRIAKVLKEKERHIIVSTIGRLIASSLVGAAIFLFSSWAVMKLIPTHIGLGLIAGLGLTGFFLVLVLPKLFKTFIVYYEAKYKTKSKPVEDPDLLTLSET